MIPETASACRSRRNGAPLTRSPALIGFVVTASLVTCNLQSGNALTILVAGAIVTAAAVVALSKLPATRPSLTTRLNWWLADLRPQVSCSHPGPAADDGDLR